MMRQAGGNLYLLLVLGVVLVGIRLEQRGSVWFFDGLITRRCARNQAVVVRIRDCPRRVQLGEQATLLDSMPMVPL